MEFIVIMIVAVVTANSISDGSSTIQESKELKKIEQVVKPEAAKQEIAKQEKINQSTINSDSLIEKAVNYFSQYYLIGLILAAIAYIYFRTRKKITLKEILARKEFNEKQQEQITEEIKPEPSVEPTTTEEFKPEPSVEPTTAEEVKSDSQSPESSDEEEKK